MKLVLDTDVMVAALRSDAGASRRLLKLLLDHRLSVVISVPLAIEYEAVLTRPEQLAASGLDAVEVGILLDAIVALATQVKLAFLWRPVLRDPNDDMVLETAVNGGADVIVTFNAKDFRAAAQFGIAVLSPGDVLRLREIG